MRAFKRKWFLKTLVLAIAAGAFFAHFSFRSPFYFEWNTSELPYYSPVIPGDYRGHVTTHIPHRTDEGVSVTTRIEAGSTVYKLRYALGWQLCLQLFGQRDPVWNKPGDPFHPLNDESLPNEYLIPTVDGYRDCVAKLEKLLGERTEAELQKVLNIRPSKTTSASDPLVIAGWVLVVGLLIWVLSDSPLVSNLLRGRSGGCIDDEGGLGACKRIS